MKSVFLVLLFLMVNPPFSYAEVSGRGTRFDARIQTAVYTPDNVYRIFAAKNRTTAIQLEPGETINQGSGAMAAGKNDDWKIGANKAGDLILIKPSLYATEPETNIVINTNRRLYLFELKLVANQERMTYLLRFNYPKPPKPGVNPFKGKVFDVDPCEGAKQHQHYLKRGDMSLSPYRVWDNGTFTCLQFPYNSPRPVVYEVLPDGTESMIASHNVHDIVVIHAVSQELRLRLNRLVLGIYRGEKPLGRYQYKGATDGKTREVKKDVS